MALEFVRFKSILGQLQSRVVPNKPLLPQTVKHFVLPLWGRGVVSRTSLRGRISCFFSDPRDNASNEKKVQEFFAQAAQSLIGSSEGKEEHVRRLYLECDQARLLRSSSKKIWEPDEGLGHLNGALDEIDEQKQQAAALKAKPRVIVSAIGNVASDPIDVEQLESALSGKEEEEPYLVDFLRDHPDFVAGDLLPWVESINKGKQARSNIRDACFPNGKKLSRKKRKAKLIELAAELSLEAKGEHFVFHGSYGKQSNGLEAVQTALNFVKPEDVPKSLRPYVNGKLPDPEKLIDSGFAMVQERIQGLLGLRCPAELHALFPDESRQLPEDLQSGLIPGILKSWIHRWWRDGLLEDIRRYMPAGSLEAILGSIAKHASAIENIEARKKFIAETEVWLKSMAKDTVRSGIGQLDGALRELLETASKYVPGVILEAAALETLITGGQYLLRFEKQKNGKFTLLVYSSGMAIRQHPSRTLGDREEVQWPLRISNISEDKLSPDFFLRLLQHQIEPECDRRFRSRAEDLYTVFEKYLGGKIEASDWRQIDPFSDSWIEFLETCLVKPESPQHVTRIALHYEAFLRYCKGAMENDGDTLVVKNAETATVLRKAIAKLSVEIERLPAETREKMKETLDEVSEALAKFHGQCGEGEQVGEQLRNWLATKGAAAIQHVQDVRRELTWALGDKVGELIDTLLQLTPQKKGALSAPDLPMEKESKGWLRTILQYVTWSTVLKTLAICRMGKYAMDNPRSPLVWMTVAHFGLSRLAPHPIRDWYGSVQQKYMSAWYTIQHKIIEFIVHLILRCVASKKQLESLKIYRQQLGTYAKVFSDEIKAERKAYLFIASDSSTEKVAPAMASLER